MEIESTDHGGVTVSEIKGDLSIQTVEQLKAAVAKLRNTHLVLNLAECPYIDSMGLATLIELTKIQKTTGVTLHLSNVSQKIQSLFDLISHKRLFNIFPDVRTAVVALKPSS